MKRKTKVFLITFSVLIVLLGAGGGYIFWRLAPAKWTNQTIEIGLSFETIDTIDWIEAFGDLGYQNHIGIDFGVNATTNIITCCDLRVTFIDTRLNEYNGLWQTNIGLKYSWKYSVEYIFESFAQNETFGNLQREAISVKVGQVLTKGALIGQLLYHSQDSLLHISVIENNEYMCPYLYFDSTSKATFDVIFSQVGSHSDPCN